MNMAEKSSEKYDLWTHEVKRPSYPEVTADERTDVLVIGGGITGIFCAYLLAKGAKKVIVLEKNKLGEATTACTTAFLTQSIDTSYSDIDWSLGSGVSRAVAAAHRSAIDLIKETVSQERIDCEFRPVDDHIIVFDKKGADALQKEKIAMERAGIKAGLSYENNLGFFPVFAYLRLEDQAAFHPLKFLGGLADCAQRAGAKIYEGTEAKIKERTSEEWIIEANSHQIKTKYIISATYDPYGQPWHLFFKKGRYISYVQEYSAPAGAITPGLYEDFSDPYHYFRVDEFANKIRIIFGGEDHREDIKINKDRNYRALDLDAREILKGIPLVSERHWSGTILEPLDGLAYIGWDERTGIYQAFGFSGNGLTYAAIAAGIISESILGNTEKFSSFRDLFAINRRISLRQLIVKGRDYSRIFFGGAFKNFFGIR